MQCAEDACAQVFQISVSSTYGVADFKENLLALYSKAGMRGIPITFLLTDNQIVNEKFLVYINDLLSTGYVADLCSPVRMHPLHECECPEPLPRLDAHTSTGGSGGQGAVLQCSAQRGEERRPDGHAREPVGLLH